MGQLALNGGPTELRQGVTRLRGTSKTCGDRGAKIGRVSEDGGMSTALALDLDGTLFLPPAPDEPPRISRRVIDAVHRAEQMGYLVLPATGRPPQGLAQPLAPLMLSGPMVVCNGAAAVNVDSRVLFEELIPAHVLAETVAAIQQKAPGVKCAVVRDGGFTLLVEEGYPQLVRGFKDHLREPAELMAVPLDELLAEGAINLIVRHPEIGPRELAALVAELPDVVPMYSNDLLLEVQARGVSKATGVARVCAAYGIGPEHVIAFGDSQNDWDLLAWAGCSVAMGNASPELKELADLVAPANFEDGVAVVLEELLDGDELPPELADQLPGQG